MNELKNVHYTGTELLWLESGFPEKPQFNDPGHWINCTCEACLSWIRYERDIRLAISKAVRFEDKKIIRDVLWCFQDDFELVAGESYYLNPKLVEVVDVEKLGRFQKVSRIIELVEQKESQEPTDDFKLWYDFLYEVGSRCFLLHGEGFDETKWEVMRDQLKAKGYSITRNPVTK